MSSLVATFVAVASVGHVIMVAALKREKSQAKYREHDRLTVLDRMRWWVEGAGPKPTSDRFLLFTPDAGGPNNIRIGWEMSAVVALRTGRTFVLPPASPMYLLDWGPRTNWHGSLDPANKTKIEDLINLVQLKSKIPTLTAEEFERQVGKSWREAREESAQVDVNAICNFEAYEAVEDKVLFMPGDGRREGFSCGEWWKLGGPKEGLRESFADNEWALLTHGFVWHPDAFTIASHAVSHMGIFNYNALHARYNDFQFHDAQQGIQDIVDRWGSFLGKESLTLYIASDEPKKIVDSNTSNMRVEFMQQLFGEYGEPDNDAAPLAAIRKQFSAERWFKMMGPAEELICTFARLFVGTESSTFSGHIQRMRLHAKSPVTLTLTHKKPVDEAKIAAQLASWEGSLDDYHDFTSGFHRLPRTKGDSFVQGGIAHVSAP